MGDRLTASVALAAVAAIGSGGLLATAWAGAGPAEEPRATLRVLAYNIHHGAGNDEVLDLERIGRLIRSLDPHLVALQEVDNRTERTGGVDQAAELARLTGMSPAFGKFMDFQGGEYGMAALSSLPIVASHNHRLPEGAEARSALAVRVRLPGDHGELTFAGIHFYRTEEERLAQARRLLEMLAPEEGPVILAVDKLPTELPREASAAFGASLEPYVPALAAADFTVPFEQLALPGDLKRALIAHEGKLTPAYAYLQPQVEAVS